MLNLQTIDRRNKSALIESNVISLFGRLKLNTSSHIVNRIPDQSYKYREFIEHQTKEQCTRLRNNFNLFSTESSRFYYFHTLKRTLHKMKDLVNGTHLIENGNNLIADQKNTYSNGVSNGDR